MVLASFFGLLAFWPQCLAFFPVCILASLVNKEAKIQTGKEAKHWGQKAKRPKTKDQKKEAKMALHIDPIQKPEAKKHVHPFQKLVIDWVFPVNFHFSLDPSCQRGRVYRSNFPIWALSNHHMIMIQCRPYLINVIINFFWNVFFQSMFYPPSLTISIYEFVDPIFSWKIIVWE